MKPIMSLYTSDSTNCVDISVVVLAYNRQDTIAQALDSILRQKCTLTYEIIIANDVSTDQTYAISLYYQEQNPDKIRILNQEENKGPVINYLDALAICKGKYIAKCDSDDYWIDDFKLQKQFDFLEANPDYGVVRTNGYCLNTFTNKMYLMTNHSNCVGNVFDIATEGPLGLASSILYRRELLQYIDYEAFTASYFSADDYPMQVIFAYYTKFGFLPDITVVYRVQPQSESNTTNPEKKLKYLTGFFNQKLYLSKLFPEFKFDPVEGLEYLSYIKLKMQYDRMNYKEANTLANSIKGKFNKRKYTQFAKNPFTFYIISVAKPVFMYVRTKLNGYK